MLANRVKVPSSNRWSKSVIPLIFIEKIKTKQKKRCWILESGSDVSFTWLKQDSRSGIVAWIDDHMKRSIHTCGINYLLLVLAQWRPFWKQMTSILALSLILFSISASVITILGLGSALDNILDVIFMLMVWLLIWLCVFFLCVCVCVWIELFTRVDSHRMISNNIDRLSTAIPSSRWSPFSELCLIWAYPSSTTKERYNHTL